MKRTIVLTEYQPQRFPVDALSELVAERLWQHYRHLVEVDFPSPKQGGQWQLTAQGWVGMLPVARDLTLVLQPKVTIANLLRLVEIAFDLHAWQLFAGTVTAATLPELYERLALILAQRVLVRCRRGLYRPYQAQQAGLPYLRGRLQVETFTRQPVQELLPCHYQEQRVDVADNQILAWTLQTILRGEFCRESSRVTIRQALRALQPLVTLRPFTSQECRHRTYSRLHEDYAPLHALCAFFLEASGPSHLPGDTASIPFVVNMGRLYEQFVAAWLRAHLPAAWELQSQERHPLSSELYFAIDLVLYARHSGQVQAVLDTKYKVPTQSPQTADVAQVVAYAAAKGASAAYLIYPQPLAVPLDIAVGGVRVRSLTFGLDGDLALAGQALLAALGLP